MTGRFAVRGLARIADVELEAVLAGHLDVGHHDVEAAAALQQRDRLVDRRGRRHDIAGGLEHRRQHVAEERRIVDQQHMVRRGGGLMMPPMQPILERQRQVMGDVDHLGGLALDDRGAENARRGARQLDIEPLLDDVDDLVDHQAHGAALVGEHQQRLRAAALRRATSLLTGTSGMSWPRY